MIRAKRVLHNDEEARFYCDEIRKLPPNAVIVEVGVWMGAMTVKAAQAALEGSALAYWAVDHFLGSPDLKNPHGPAAIEREFRDAIQKAGLDILVSLMRKPSLEAAKEFTDGSLDMVFIDGDHTKPAVLADIGAWWPKLRMGGVLLGHDFDPEHQGVVEAVLERFGGPDALSKGKFPVWKVTKKPGR